MTNENPGIFKDNLSLILKAKMADKGLMTKDIANKIDYTYEGTRKAINGNGSYWAVWKISRVLDIKMKFLLKEDLIDK